MRIGHRQTTIPRGLALKRRRRNCKLCGAPQARSSRVQRLSFGGLVTGTAVRRGLERSDLVHHVLLVDEVAGRLERVEQLRDVVRPVVEQLVWRLRRGETHNPSRPVDARVDGLVRDNLAELLLGLVEREREELRETRELDPRIVAADRQDVVLRHAAVQRLEHLLLLALVEVANGHELGGDARLHILELENLLGDEGLEQGVVEGELGEPLLLLQRVHLVRLLVVVL
mmetsp:Transcript_40781/g.134988  ORF Transcript_40781/g.134988 Transcript_40781/m.134988 type:complete len:228 (+) Transcript_40781:22-705(+)